MERTIEIEYRYDDVNERRLSAQTVELLEEEAMRRIPEMMQQGYRHGELVCMVKDKEYLGWWDAKMR